MWCMYVRSSMINHESFPINCRKLRPSYTRHTPIIHSSCNHLRSIIILVNFTIKRLFTQLWQSVQHRRQKGTHHGTGTSRKPPGSSTTSSSPETTSWKCASLGIGVGFGFYGQLIRELEAENHSDFANVMRMPPQMFREVLGWVGPLRSKKDIRWHDALEPGLKLAITLWHIATGDIYTACASLFE